MVITAAAVTLGRRSILVIRQGTILSGSLFGTEWSLSWEHFLNAPDHSRSLVYHTGTVAVHHYCSPTKTPWLVMSKYALWSKSGAFLRTLSIGAFFRTLSVGAVLRLEP